MYDAHDDRLWEEAFALLDQVKSGKAGKKEVQAMREFLSICRDIAEIQLVMSKAVYTGSQAARFIEAIPVRKALVGASESSDEPC